MRTVATNTSTAMWWSRPGSACTTTTGRLAALHVLEGATDIQFSEAAASVLQPHDGEDSIFFTGAQLSGQEEE